MTQDLNGRVALITGGDSGIGAACALAFAGAGADVALLFHADENAAHAVAAMISDGGRRALAIQADVGEPADVERAFGQVEAQMTRADILVNSAGVNMSNTPVSEMDPLSWDRLIKTDLTGTFLTSRRFVRALRETGTLGAIINMTSIHAFAMRAGGADYAAAKGGQTNLTRTMAIECAALGIRVNAIAPGMILTEMNQEAKDDPERRSKLEKSIPLGRAGEAEEVAALALFLASPAAAYITGASVPIDGGLSLLMGQGA